MSWIEQKLTLIYLKVLCLRLVGSCTCADLCVYSLYEVWKCTLWGVQGPSMLDWRSCSQYLEAGCCTLSKRLQLKKPLFLFIYLFLIQQNNIIQKLCVSALPPLPPEKWNHCISLSCIFLIGALHEGIFRDFPLLYFLP